jgi:hypothetical protein
MDKANIISALHETLTFDFQNKLLCQLRNHDGWIADYRFYAEDMLHPNQVAIDYIWKRFVETTISETFCDGRSRKHSKSLSHKPLTQILKVI